MNDTYRRRSRATIVLLGCACVALATAGCIKTPIKSPLMKESDNLVDITSIQLRQQLYDFTARYATVVEGASNRIMRATDDPTVRERALLWKARSISEAHRAAFKPDPLLGLIDTAVLCGQQVDFFSDGPGSSLFGEQAEIAIEASVWLDTEVWRLAESITLTGDPTLARSQVAEFVDQHPIGDAYFLRDSVDPLVRMMTPGRAHGAGAAIGGLNEAVDDLSRRLTIYAAHLPKEARWQAELAAMEMVRRPPMSESLNALESVAASHRQFADSVAEAIELIPAERALAFDELNALARVTVEDVERQRLESIAELQAERDVLVGVLEAQIDQAFKKLTEERIATVNHVEQMLAGTVASSFDRVDELADRLFLRGLILVAILALALLAVGVLVARMLRPRPAL